MTTQCHRCKGQKFVQVRLRDMSGKQYGSCGVPHTIGCPMCNGKGFITDEDRAAERKAWGLPPLKS